MGRPQTFFRKRYFEIPASRHDFNSVYPQICANIGKIYSQILQNKPLCP